MTVSTAMLAFPLRIVGGRYATVERDSYEEIAQGVEVVLRTRRGDRIERPEFGVRSLVFDDASSLQEIVTHVEAAITDADPRASVIVEEDTSDLEAMILGIGVTVEEGSTNG
jgi:phage baseplate assembly protein W